MSAQLTRSLVPRRLAKQSRNDRHFSFTARATSEIVRQSLAAGQLTAAGEPRR
jgi:hypothetical protein